MKGSSKVSKGTSGRELWDLPVSPKREHKWWAVVSALRKRRTEIFPWIQLYHSLLEVHRSMGWEKGTIFFKPTPEDLMIYPSPLINNQALPRCEMMMGWGSIHSWKYLICSDTSSLQIVSVSKNTVVQGPGFGRTGRGSSGKGRNHGGGSLSEEIPWCWYCLRSQRKEAHKGNKTLEGSVLSC